MPQTSDLPADHPTSAPTTSAHPASAPAVSPAGEAARRRCRVHRAWFVVAVAFVTITGAAAFRSLPGMLIDPLHEEFAW
ncbi:hypothetical protein SSP531S_46490 [Streptomyces spongiicola]|uniref:MFS transporter n=1 Tax=Streptomyces spongiicola TaxID=1690221 RepID=A0A388T345_9ACTN|nr:hypothetical protein SSP531S_46490 [Streptomyces spongiicola]